MKHTFDELLGIIYQYYPRGVELVDGVVDMKAVRDSEEHARLVAARQKAATDERWHAMRRRIQERFPEAMVMNHSLHLPTGHHDACYSFTIHLPGAAEDRLLWGLVSLLAPYYVIHASCNIEIVKETRKDFFPVVFQGIHFQVSRSPLDPELISNVDDEALKFGSIRRHVVTFDLLPEERPYAAWIAGEIEATFGGEPMPPEIGTVLVPDLATPKLPGEVRLYDCLFSDRHEWVFSPADESAPVAVVDAHRLTEPFFALLTILAAAHGILFALERAMRKKSFYAVVRTDGILRKEDMVHALAEIHRRLDLAMAPSGMAGKGKLEAATHELEALITSWNGEGAPPDAMVAWASSFLANWDVGTE